MHRVGDLLPMYLAGGGIASFWPSLTILTADPCASCAVVLAGLFRSVSCTRMWCRRPRRTSARSAPVRANSPGGGSRVRTGCSRGIDNTGEKGIGKAGKALHFKGVPFHRIIPGFMCQGGDITSGNVRPRRVVDTGWPGGGKTAFRLCSADQLAARTRRENVIRAGLRW